MKEESIQITMVNLGSGEALCDWEVVREHLTSPRDPLLLYKDSLTKPKMQI